MGGQAFQSAFCILHATFTVFKPVDVLSLLTVQITIHLDMKRHLLENTMKIVDLKDGIVTLLCLIRGIGNFIPRGKACGIPCPFLSEPVMSLAHWNIKSWRISLRRPYSEDRGK